MQLAIIADRWDETRGGCETYLAGLAGSLVKTGVEVTVYCREGGAAADGILLQRIGAARYPQAFRELSFYHNLQRRFPVKTARRVLSVCPTVTATHYQPHAGVLAAAFEGERESMDSTLRRWLYWPATHLNAKRQVLLRLQEKTVTASPPPRLMTFSRQVRDDFCRYFGMKERDIFSCAQGVDLGRFHPPKGESDEHRPGTAGDGELRLLFVAHNFVLKGLHCLLAALGEACRHGLKARLQVIGNGPIAGFSKLAADRGIAERVQFRGLVRQADLAALYRWADALVHPSFYDHCSLATLEALASGCAVITTRSNGASELMEHGRQGLILEDPRNTRALVEALQTLQDPQRLNSMRLHARRLGHTFDSEAHVRSVAAWLGLKEDLAAGSL